MKTVRDSLTADMFSVQPATRFDQGRVEVCRVVSQVLEGRDRSYVAAQMSELEGQPVSKNMLDAWASPGREAHNIPFYQAPVLEFVCESHRLADWLLHVRGGRAAYGDHAIKAQLGQALAAMEQERADLLRHIKATKQKLGAL